MSTKRVVIESDNRLDGLLTEGSSKAGAVVCHPHPLYGGNMRNNVVDAIETGFSHRGFTVLKFDFRGVSGSEGRYDEGIGEVRDVLATVSFLKNSLDGDATIVLAGYSFGAWVGSRAAPETDAAALFLVSYPFAFYAPDPLLAWRKNIYLIGGDRDEIGPVKDLVRVYKEMDILEKNLKIIPTDHFYWGKEGEIVGFIEELFQPFR